MTLPRDHGDRLARARLALEGLSVGDAFGERFFRVPLVVESMINARAVPKPPWRYTDDTEMALSVVQVLSEYGSIDQDLLASAFSNRFDPGRGYGAIANRILREIGLGGSWRLLSTAAFEGQGSWGNGGAMRAAPIGAYFADDLPRVVEEARLSAEVTHAHPDGQAGAIATALGAAILWQGREGKSTDVSDALGSIAERVPKGPTRDGIYRAAQLAPGASTMLAASALGTGDRVTSADTVPYSLWCAFRYRDDYEEALWQTVSGLGDRDTTCAIVGGLVALVTGSRGIPDEWLQAREALPPL
jgi:ADP-ribosylglycohydrolase